jgi:hypothetical protein
MSQGIRDSLANRKFAIPLIVLLGFCLVGLILVGVVLLLRPGDSDDTQATQVAGDMLTSTAGAVDLVTFTPAPATNTVTPRPSPTLVPVATLGEGTASAPAGTGAVISVAGSPTAEATAAATSAVSQVTATIAPTASDDELAQTGVGWGLIIFAGGGLAALGVAARRLRLAGG